MHASTYDTQDVIAQVRSAARLEVDRAADIFTDRARAITRDRAADLGVHQPPVRWLRVLIALVILLFIVWLVVQVVAQESLFTWIGDRIDNMTNESTMPPLPRLR